MGLAIEAKNNRNKWNWIHIRDWNSTGMIWGYVRHLMVEPESQNCYERTHLRTVSEMELKTWARIRNSHKRQKANLCLEPKGCLEFGIFVWCLDSVLTLIRNRQCDCSIPNKRARSWNWDQIRNRSVMIGIRNCARNEWLIKVGFGVHNYELWGSFIRY